MFKRLKLKLNRKKLEDLYEQYEEGQAKLEGLDKDVDLIHKFIDEHELTPNQEHTMKKILLSVSRISCEFGDVVWEIGKEIKDLEAPDPRLNITPEGLFNYLK